MFKLIPVYSSGMNNDIDDINRYKNIGKRQCCTLSLYSENFTRGKKTVKGRKIARHNINNMGYADNMEHENNLLVKKLSKRGAEQCSLRDKHQKEFTVMSNKVLLNIQGVP